MHAQDSTMTTRSGRQVRKPERLIEHCYRGDVVILLTRDPTGMWVPDCFEGHLEDCVAAMFPRVEMFMMLK